MDFVKEAEITNRSVDSDIAFDTSGKGESRSDPHSPDFSYGDWITKFFEGPARRQKSSTSIAYGNLNVYGFGTPTDYQKTFATYPTMCISLLTKVFGRQRKSKIDILKDFEGLMRSGEMLMVLGK